MFTKNKNTRYKVSIFKMNQIIPLEYTCLELVYHPLIAPLNAHFISGRSIPVCSRPSVCNNCHFLGLSASQYTNDYDYFSIIKLRPYPGVVGLAPKCVRLAPNGTHPGLFSNQISVHLAPRAKCTEI